MARSKSKRKGRARDGAGNGEADAAAKAATNFRTIARNKRATFNYAILERFEAGLALTGTEIKAIREGKASIAEAYVRPRGRELWLVGATIARYEAASHGNHDPTRDRKLLLHRREIQALAEGAEQKGLTVVPIHLYLKRGLAKLEIGLGRGKRQYDKRQAIAKREAERRMRQSVRQ